MSKNIVKKPIEEKGKGPKLASVEILKFSDPDVIENMENMSEENFEIIYNSNLMTRYIPVTDLKDKYVIKVSTLKENSTFDVIDPNEVNPLDQFELTESITQILQKMGIDAEPLKSDEEIQREAFEAGKKKLKEIQQLIKEKLKKIKGKEDEPNARESE